jgi:hypothetical protein
MGSRFVGLDKGLSSPLLCAPARRPAHLLGCSACLASPQLLAQVLASGHHSASPVYPRAACTSHQVLRCWCAAPRYSLLGAPPPTGGTHSPLGESTRHSASPESNVERRTHLLVLVAPGESQRPFWPKAKGQQATRQRQRQRLDQEDQGPKLVKSEDAGCSRCSMFNREARPLPLLVAAAGCWPPLASGIWDLACVWGLGLAETQDHALRGPRGHCGMWASRSAKWTMDQLCPCAPRADDWWLLLVGSCGGHGHVGYGGVSGRVCPRACSRSRVPARERVPAPGFLPKVASPAHCCSAVLAFFAPGPLSA